MISCKRRGLVCKSSVRPECDVCLPVVETSVAVGAEAGGFCAWEGHVDESAGYGVVDEEDHVSCIRGCRGIGDGGVGSGHWLYVNND